MFRLWGKNLVYNLMNFLNFSIFFTLLRMRFKVLYLSIVGFSQCVCTYPINLMGVYFLRYTHNNEHIETHDIVCNTFVIIVWDVVFHVVHQQLHALPSTMCNPLVKKSNWHCVHQRWNSHIVIANPMHANQLPQLCTIQRLVASKATQVKNIYIYYNWHPTNPFFKLVIDIFGYLHKQADVFLHDCASAIWKIKESKIRPLFCFDCFSLTLNFNYVAKDASILHFKSGSSNKANYFSASTSFKHNPIATTDLLQVVGCWDGEFLTSSLC
jgi:hypothetical protein